MPFAEHAPGHGTIAYRGEPPEYWFRKSALYRERRRGAWPSSLPSSASSS